MTKFKKVISVVMVIAIALMMQSVAFAHETFLDAPTTGEVGAEVVVTVVRGHFDEGPDAGTYFEDLLAETTLPWGFKLVKPDGTKEDLTLTAKDDTYVVSFTPDAAGVYQVAYERDRGVRDYGYAIPTGFQRILEEAKAYIVVGGDKAGLENVEDAMIAIKLDDPAVASGQVLFGGDPLAGATVTMTTKDSWVKTATTDAEGKFSIDAPGAGAFMLKATYFDETPGTEGDQEFIGVRPTTVVLFTAE